MSYPWLQLVLLFVLLAVNLAACAKILGVFPAIGYSQFILGDKLMTELAQRGHNVTLISPYTPSTNLIRTISTNGILAITQGSDLFMTETFDGITRIRSIHTLGYRVTEYTLADPGVQKLINSKENFDLVIVEQFVDEALMGLAPHFGAPLVALSSIGLSDWNRHQMSNPGLPSITPITQTPFTTRMTFRQRFTNTFMSLFDILYKQLVAFPLQDKLLKKYFPKPMDLENVIYNTSLMLLNSHFSITDPCPLVHGMVEIGGFHIQPKPLSSKIQEFLDSATKGAIYFSMGTNLNSSNLNEEMLASILGALSQLEQKVLWKFEKDLPNKPANVMIAKWLPQVDILGHPNIKLFISHGGLLGLTEAVHFGVPLVGIPIFGDQRMNIAKAVDYGFAVSLPFQQLSEVTLTAAIREALSNPKYRENVQRRSSLYHDQPLKPMELAMYWIEYVIRHRGTQFRNASMDLSWYQLYLLDIIGLCAIVVLVALLVLILALRYTRRKVVVKFKKQ